MRRCTLVILTLCYLTWSLTLATESQNGTSTKTFNTLDTLQTISYSFYGEGLAYDKKRDRFILGSLDLGTLIAVPRSTVPEKNIHYDEDGVTMILSSRPEMFNGSNFLGLEMDPVNDDIVWGCISYGEFSTYGIARVNMTNNTVDFYDLSALANPTIGSKSVLNDLALSPNGEYIFITDTWGYQIIRFSVTSKSAEVWNNGEMFCTECLTNESHFDGPNGIVYVSVHTSECLSSADIQQSPDDYLIIGLGASSNRLLKVNASFAFDPPIEVNVAENAGVLSQIDGLVMSLGDKPTLFVVGNGVNSVFALTSSDDWITATLRLTFNANCPQYQPSAAVLVDNSDIVCYCTNGFGPAPYPLTFVTQVPEKVVATPGIQLSLPGMQGEGIEYDPLQDRLIVGSMSSGAIRGVPNSASREVYITESEVYTYFQGGGIYSITAVVGLKVDPTNSCWLWMAVKSTPIGVAMVNICVANKATEPNLFLDLSHDSNAAFGSSPNDLTIVADDLYVTDFQGGYVWKISLTKEFAYTISIFLEFDPAVERPNGIEHIGDFLLISLMDSDRLMRVNIKTQEEKEVDISPRDVFSSGDGLRFDEKKEVLYVARHNDNSILALASCDGWDTAQIATDFSANCLEFIGSVGVTTMAMARSDLWVFCSDNFGDGPYAFNRVNNVSSKVYSGFQICIREEDDEDHDNASSESDDAVSVIAEPLFWVSIALACAFLTLMVVALHWKSAITKWKSKAYSELLQPQSESLLGSGSVPSST